jgi:hypothetical protein
MNDSDKNWIRSLPLLLMASILMVGAAWAFFRGKDSTASIASFAAGLILLGAWLTTAIVDWSHNKPQLVKQEEELDEQS